MEHENVRARALLHVHASARCRSPRRRRAQRVGPLVVHVRDETYQQQQRAVARADAAATEAAWRTAGQRQTMQRHQTTVRTRGNGEGRGGCQVRWWWTTTQRQREMFVAAH